VLPIQSTLLLVLTLCLLVLSVQLGQVEASLATLAQRSPSGVLPTDACSTPEAQP
jgi:hypothetical protein